MVFHKKSLNRTWTLTSWRRYGGDVFLLKEGSQTCRSGDQVAIAEFCQRGQACLFHLVRSLVQICFFDQVPKQCNF